MIDGISNLLAYPSALGYVFKHRLYKYLAISGLISLCIAGVIFSSVYFWSDDLALWLVDFYPFERGKETLSGIGKYVIGGGMSVLGLIAYKYILLVVIGPFMGPLSEEVEYIETGIEPESQGLGKLGYQFIRGIRISLRNIFRELTLTLLILLLGLIPVFSPFSAVAIFILQAYYIGFANMDYHLEKRNSLSQSVAFCREHRWALIGNGTGFLLLLFIPVIGLLLAPVLGTVVATRYALKYE